MMAEDADGVSLDVRVVLKLFFHSGRVAGRRLHSPAPQMTSADTVANSPSATALLGDCWTVRNELPCR